MKKVLMLCATLIMLMGSVCSAAPTRVFDGGINDFVTLYNQLAQEFYSHMKVDAKLYQKPFKNATASYDNYTAYTCKVGNKDKMSPYITLMVDKSGYVAQAAIIGYIKDADVKSDHEKLFASTMAICVTMSGLDPHNVEDYVSDVFPLSIEKGEKQNSYSMWSEYKKREIHIDTKQNGMLDKYTQYIIHIYATTD